MAQRRDIEDTEQELNQYTADSFEFWQEKQRELVSSVVDYNLGSLTNLVTSGAIDISPRYQRRLRWGDERQSKLIESFLMNVPVPPIFLNEDEYGQFSVIDGKQRITAITEFFRGRLKLKGLEVFNDLNGQTIDDLSPKLRRVLETRPNIRAIIILRQSDPDIKFEVFQRLNTGGVKLNAQEIRNSAFPGPLNDLVLSLSESQDFHDALGIRSKRTSAIWQEMRDAEFVLRFLTFRDTWATFSGGMRRHMDEYMEEHRNASDNWIAKAREDFEQALLTVRTAFGQHAFQRWQPGKKQWRKQVLAALYDAQMFAAYGLEANRISGGSSRILREFKKLFSDDAFRNSIDAATNTPALFKERIQTVKDLLRSID